MSGTAVCPTCGAPVATDARFCASCGTPLGRAAPEERKLATILFADVIGSTDLGEQLDPERLRALLAEYFAAMARVVQTWDGSIEKYIGDAIMAVWGVPTAREDDPGRALHAAREMIAELDRINPQLEARHGVRLGIRIGVNTGEVIAPLGSHTGGQFLVSGDAVNVAARLEQAAEPGTVLVGERTWLATRAAFEFAEPDALTLKGKREPIAARVLTGLASADMARTQFQAPMVGRDRELNTLIGLLDEAIESGMPRLVLVSGPAGIGKSRMLREFILNATDRAPDVSVLRGRCLATGHGITFWAFGEILRVACGISLDEPAESAAEKLERRTAGPLASIGLSHDEIAETVAALATSANLPSAHDSLAGRDPEEVADAMSRAWPRLLTGTARARPVAVLIEDVHWADEPMLRMIDAVATRSEGPILIVATARPEFVETHAGFGSAPGVSVVALRPLTEAQSGRLIDELLDGSHLPAALVAEIQRKADGNPFFVEELIQRLVDVGALVQGDRGWQATERAETVQLPDTIHALLASRIDALPADEKRLVQESAVVGRTFWPGALAAAEFDDVMDLLRRVERRGLILARPTSTIENEPEYAFRHVLIRDVAYASVPKKRRARAHADIGRWIEQLAGDRTEEFGELIAFHYRVAVTGDDAELAWADDHDQREQIRGRAFEMQIRSGASARRRFAIDKALELHADALALAASNDERARAHDELGDDHEALFHGDDAVREYLAALDEAGATEVLSHVAAEEAEFYGVDERVDRAGALVAKAGRMVLRWGTFQEEPPLGRIQALVEASLRQRTTKRVRATLLMVYGGILPGPTGAPIAAGRTPVRRETLAGLKQRIESIESSLEIALQLDDPDLLYLGNELLGMAYQSAGEYAKMRRAAERQAALLDRLTSTRRQVDSLVSLASVRDDAGDFQAALEAAEDGFARAVSLSGHERMHIGYEVVAAAEQLGRWDRVAELFPWFAAASAAEGDITCPSVRAGPIYAAIVLCRRGEVSSAIEVLPIETAQQTVGTFITGAQLANYASLAGPADRALELTKRALESTAVGFVELGVVPLIEALTRQRLFDALDRFLPVARQQAPAVRAIGPAIERAEGVLALEHGDRQSAEASMRRALQQFEELAMPFEVAQTQELTAKVAGEVERLILLRESLARYESLGARPYAERVREQLAADRTAAI